MSADCTRRGGNCDGESGNCWNDPAAGFTPEASDSPANPAKPAMERDEWLNSVESDCRLCFQDSMGQSVTSWFQFTLA